MTRKSAFDEAMLTQPKKLRRISERLCIVRNTYRKLFPPCSIITPSNSAPPSSQTKPVVFIAPIAAHSKRQLDIWTVGIRSRGVTVTERMNVNVTHWVLGSGSEWDTPDAARQSLGDAAHWVDSHFTAIQVYMAITVPSLYIIPPLNLYIPSLPPQVLNSSWPGTFLSAPTLALTMEPCAGHHVHPAAALHRREVGQAAEDRQRKAVKVMAQAQAQAQARARVTGTSDGVSIAGYSSATSGSSGNGCSSSSCGGDEEPMAANDAAMDVRGSFACVQGSVNPPRPNMVDPPTHPSNNGHTFV